MNDIKEHFLNYELSKELKYLGFDSNCLGYYDENEKLRPVDTDFNNFRQLSKHLIAVPLISQVELWLIQKHKLSILLYQNGNHSEYTRRNSFYVVISSVRVLDKRTNKFDRIKSIGSNKFISGDFSPLEAKLVGIKECIKIIKEKE